MDIWRNKALFGVWLVRRLLVFLVGNVNMIARFPCEQLCSRCPGLPRFNNPPSCALLTRPRVPRHFFHYRLTGRKFIRPSTSDLALMGPLPLRTRNMSSAHSPHLLSGWEKDLELIFLSAVVHALPRSPSLVFYGGFPGNCEKNLNSVLRVRVRR